MKNKIFQSRENLLWIFWARKLQESERVFLAIKHLRDTASQNRV